DRVARMVDEVEKGRGWAHALIYEEPVALRKMNDVIATTQRLLDRVERGEGAAGVLTSSQSTVSARRFVAAMDKLSRMAEQPGTADEGLVPALLFDPKYKNVLEDLKVVAHNFREVSDRLVGGKGTLGELIKDEPADASIRQASRDLQAALANLKEITAKINDGEGTLGALIADPTVYERPEAPARARRGGAPASGRPQPLKDVVLDAGERLPTGIAELDRVLGGGVVRGSLVLIGGEPGAGKCVTGDTRVFDPATGDY